MEHGEKKNTLIKLRLCPDCSYKLNYHHKKKLAKQTKKEQTAVSEKSRSSGKRKKQLRHEGPEDRNRSDSGDDRDDGDGQSRDCPCTSSEALHTRKATNEQDIWKGPGTIAVDKTREEEFEEYFEDMFL